jgi:hypothetical protein
MVGMSHARIRRQLLAIAGAIAAVLIASPAAVAGPGDFYSSFEDGDPAPTWIDTVDTDQDGNERAAGVTGPTRDGLPGDVTDKVIAVRANGENSGAGEVAENLVDGSAQTKWLVFEETGWVELELSEPVAVVHYALTSANDAAERDPKDWTLSGSNDGQSWTQLDAQTGQDFPERFQQKEYRFENTTAYKHYRLDITANHGADIVQLAELALSNGDTTPPPPPTCRAASARARAAAIPPSRASASPASRRSASPARTRPTAAATRTTRCSTSTSRSTATPSSPT